MNPIGQYQLPKTSRKTNCLKKRYLSKPASQKNLCIFKSTHNLKWESLQNRRENLKVNKIRNNLVNIPCNHCLISSTSITRHHQYCYQLPYSQIDSHLHSFFPSAIKLWNNLSQQQVDAHSLTTFKQTL